MEQVMIVMVPFAAQGHLNQLLHFAINLSSSSTHVDLPVHYACSASYIRQAKSRIQGRDSASLDKVHFHELPLPPFPTPPPDPASNFPNHLLPSFEAAMKLRAPLAALFLSLSAGCRRLIVVYDPMMSFVSADVASLPNAESYRFQCVPSYNELHHFCRQPDYDASKLRREVLDVILDPFEGCFSPEFWVFIANHYIDVAAEAGSLFNSCRPIEGEFLDLLSGVPRYRGKKVFAVGPLNPLAIERNSTTTTAVGPSSSHDKHGCLEWLDEQPPASVLYVSFGSTSTMSDEQIERLAVGLERSGQRFIWVVRDADLGDIYAAGRVRREGRREGGGGERVGAAASDSSPPFHGRVHEPLRMELLHGEPEHGRPDRGLARALGPAEERGPGDRILEDGRRGAGVGPAQGFGVVGSDREGDQESDGAVLRGRRRDEDESSAAGRSHTPLRGRRWIFKS